MVQIVAKSEYLDDMYCKSTILSFSHIRLVLFKLLQIDGWYETISTCSSMPSIEMTRITLRLFIPVSSLFEDHSNNIILVPE
jgi:hypothetical protein